MKDLLQLILSKPELKIYFPKEEEIPKCGKEWVANVLQSLCPDAFQSFVREKEQIRRQKIDE